MSYEAKDIISLSQGRAFREKIGMYLSGDRQEAINLGLRELIVNVQDEYEVYKPANPYVNISIDTEERIICVEDNMRGIPCAVREDGINSLTAAMLINHSGGKHVEGSYSSSVGINGCGNKIVCHTSSWLEVEVKRDGIIWYQKFESNDEGAYPITEVENHGSYRGQTGTKITYKPDKKVYGEFFIDVESLEQMLREMSYFTKGLKITLIVDGENEVFHSKNGLIDGLSSPDAIGKPFSYFYEQEDCKVELALQWVKKSGEIRGYANGLYMREGGAFITGFKTSLTKVFNGIFDTKFSGEQVRSMLDGFVSVKVKVGQFSNQAKTALANPEARTATAAAITAALKEYYSTNPKDMEAVVEVLRKIAKADAAAEEAREAILNHEKKEASARRRKVAMPDKFKDCEKHGQDSMLIITEGNSALGRLIAARNIENEALYAVRGKVKNLLKHPLAECLKNQEVSDIIVALGCGIQEKYNSKKLNYGKVAIASDADTDGKNIMCLIATMFFVLMPEFIIEGRLCWLQAPLYKLQKGKQAVFAYDDKELHELEETHKGWERVRFKGLGELSAEDVKASMLHPENRRLEILAIEDFEEAAESLNMLMGTKVSDRRDFLFENVDFSVLNG